MNPLRLPLSFLTTASIQAHLLCQEVWGQRQSGDHQPAGLLPVWKLCLRHPGPPGLLGKYLRAGDRRPRQPIRLCAHPLPRLHSYGTVPRCQLAAGTPQWQQLQVWTSVPDVDLLTAGCGVAFVFLCNVPQQQVINNHCTKLLMPLEHVVCVFGVYRTLMFISVDADIIMVIVMVLGVDGA